MKALSIRQPYAWAIVNGWKPVENRDWPTNFRGRVLIHAAKKEERDSVEGVIRQIAFERNRSVAELEADYAANKNLGCVVGAATITDCVTYHKSDWFCGVYAFVMDDAKGCKPVPCRGMLGFFNVPDDVASELRAQVQG